MMDVPSIKERMQDPKDRVFWDKYSQIGRKEGGWDSMDSKSIEALNDKEVVVTLQNFPYLHDKQRTWCGQCSPSSLTSSRGMEGNFLAWT